MRVLVQRVRKASVWVEDQSVGSIGAGLCILLGIGPQDSPPIARALALKIAELRIFNDAAGKMNLSLLEIGGEALVISQFTLYADTRRGRRPGFSSAAPPAMAAPLVDAFSAALRALGITVACGVFGADMLVKIQNDGPVTIWLDSAEMEQRAPT